MQLEKTLACVAAFAKPERFEDLRRNIDAGWIEQALQATGTATIRRRRLPAEQVVWLVIGMGLFRNRSIHDVVSKLDLALPGDTPTVVPSAIADARSRLGAEPMEWLFTRTATPGGVWRSMGWTAQACGFRTPMRTGWFLVGRTAAAARVDIRSCD